MRLSLPNNIIFTKARGEFAVKLTLNNKHIERKKVTISLKLVSVDYRKSAIPYCQTMLNNHMRKQGENG